MIKNRLMRKLCVVVPVIGLMCGLVSSTQSAEQGTPLEVDVPLGLPSLPVPADNPMTVEKVELGKMLYFDNRLSKDKTLSCATCHDPEYAYTEPRATSEGIKGQLGDRNSPTIINTAYFTSMFWDGREPDLEHQAGGPVENPIEMGHDMGLVAKELNAIDEYKEHFQKAFGAPPSKDTITKAIAAFERTILSGNSPYDKYMNGDKTALSEDAIAGMGLFKGKGLCASCHIPPLFSGGGFYNAGVGMDEENPDIGRMKVSNLAADKGAFRVPALREVENTSPYFHDGSVEKLEDAVEFMTSGGQDNPNLHPLFRALKAQTFSEKEIQQLVAFLKSLSGEYPIVEKPKLP